MKGLLSLITFVLLSVYAVVGEPDINQVDDTFRYWISTTTMTATIMGLKNLTAEKVVVTPYITVEGQNYYVNQLGAGALSNSAVHTLVVGNDIRSFKFGYNSLYNANKLRNVILKTQNVTADSGAFNNLSLFINFEGIGCRSLANDMSRKILESWGLPTGKNYRNVSADEFNRDLYTLAYYVKSNFYQYDKIASPENVVCVLALKVGNTNGIARAYRILARNMGFEFNDVHVGGDSGYYSWNYVYIQKDGNTKQWYNLDNIKVVPLFGVTIFLNINIVPTIVTRITTNMNIIEFKTHISGKNTVGSSNTIGITNL